MATFSHSGARGDIIYGLPTIKALGGGVLYIKLTAKFYKSIPMTEQDLAWFRGLLCGQDYIEDVRKWEPEIHVDYDLDKFRDASGPREEYSLLSESHLRAFDAHFDLFKPWIIGISPKYIADIVVNRSQRYHGPFDWHELKNWPSSVFVGTIDEHKEFTQMTGLGIPYYSASGYMDLARVIRGSKVFIGNQSFPYSLAEAMKHPRVAEVFPPAPNCLPQSSNGFTRLTQNVLGHIVLGKPLKKEKCLKFYKPVLAGRMLRIASSSLRPPTSYIVQSAVPPEFAEAAKREGAEIIVSDEANIGAAKAKGKVICIVNLASGADYRMARRVADALRNSDGLAGSTIGCGEAVYPSGPCIAVSRRAYEDCGLFNLGILSGEQSYADLNKRYTKAGYPCRSAGAVRC
jgi:hypothetical protein